MASTAGSSSAENTPVKPGSEEYLDSEKYQIKARDFGRADSLARLIGQINAIRREHRALQFDWGLDFLETDNPTAHLLRQARPGRRGSDPRRSSISIR